METRHAREVRAGLDAAAVAMPMAIGGSVLLYAQIAPEWLPHGILAGCLAMVVMHLFTARIGRPVVYTARFFEAAALAAMVQQVAERSVTWGVANTSGTRVAMACIVVAIAGVVVGLLWLARAERFARFIPAPVSVGFTNSVCVALVLGQSKVMWELVGSATHGLAMFLFIAAIIAIALGVRRWRPRWPASATALAAGAILALALPQLHMATLTVPNVWVLPHQLADFGALVAPAADTYEVLLALAQNGAILGLLVFLNTVITGQVLAQADDRQDMPRRDKLLQAAALAFCGAAGSAPISGAPNVAAVVSRTSLLTPVVLVTIAAAAALVHVSQVLAVVPAAALTAVFLADGWVMWDRVSARNLWAWLRGRTVSANAVQDVLLILAVMAASLLINMAVALVVGLLLGLVLHAHRNTRRPVRQAWTGQEISSNCARARTEVALLRAHGGEIHVLQLDANQSFLSAGQLSATIREHIAAADSVILDWSAVRDIDTSLTVMLARLQAQAAAQGVLLVHAGTQLEGGNLHAELVQHLPGACVVADLDRGLELAENRLIAKYRQELGDGEGTRFLDATFMSRLGAGEHALVMQAMRARRFEVGEAIVTRGERGDSVLLVTEGTGSVIIAFDDRPSVRLAGVRSGTLIGEVGFLDGALRSATVVADTPLSALQLERSAFDRLSREHPDVAMRLLMNISLDLASRLRNTTMQAAARHRNTVPRREERAGSV